MKRARLDSFRLEDAANMSYERWNGSRFQPIAEYRQPKLALEQLREKYQRNYVLQFEQTNAALNTSILTTTVNNLQDWSERKGALITVRSCYCKIANPNPSTTLPTVLPIDLYCSFDQDNIFTFNTTTNRWEASQFVCTLPHLVSKASFVGGAANLPASLTYQAQADDLNKVYVPAPFQNLTVELRDPWTGNLASAGLENTANYAVTYFKLVLDVQFME